MDPPMVSSTKGLEAEDFCSPPKNSEHLGFFVLQKRMLRTQKEMNHPTIDFQETFVSFSWVYL